MTNPYPPYQQPRKLERSRTNKVLGGVCGGVANYLNMDPTLVRVLTVVISLFTGVPVILYLIALFVIPEESADSGTPSYPPVTGPQWTYDGYPQSPTQAGTAPNQPTYAPTAGPGAQPGSGYGSSASTGDSVWGQEGAPWEQRQPPAAPKDPEPAPEQTSTWESTPADPSTAPDSPDDKRL